MKKNKYDIFIDGAYMETIEDDSIVKAYKQAEQKYPYALDDDVLEVRAHD